MPNLTSVTVTSGVPTAGSGTVSTLDNLIGTAGTASAQVQTVQGVASMTPVQVSQATAASLNATVVGTGTFATQAAATLAAETTKVIGVVRTADGSGNLLASTSNALNVNVSNANANGQAVMASSAPVALATDQKYQTGMSPRAFSVAFSTLTRPANTTAYTALDSISDNATPGSVTALTATVSDTNSDPLTITEVLVSSTDTGLAGKKIRAYLYNSDPTASTGVVGGDNLAFSNKKAGYIGSVSGLMETGFSDGTVGRLVPSYADGAASPLSNAGAGGFIVSAPSAAGKALWIQYQAIDGFTPSASSTTIIGTVRGFQGRAS